MTMDGIDFFFSSPTHPPPVQYKSQFSHHVCISLISFQGYLQTQPSV